jgi:hypothetical protein
MCTDKAKESVLQCCTWRMNAALLLAALQSHGCCCAIGSRPMNCGLAATVRTDVANMNVGMDSFVPVRERAWIGRCTQLRVVSCVCTSHTTGLLGPAGSAAPGRDAAEGGVACVHIVTMGLHGPAAGLQRVARASALSITNGLNEPLVGQHLRYRQHVGMHDPEMVGLNMAGLNAALRVPRSPAAAAYEFWHVHIRHSALMCQYWPPVEHVRC